MTIRVRAVKRQALAIWFVVPLLLLFASGCGSGGGGSDAAKTWTIFVYGHGDHNLSSSLVTDLDKMTQATLGSNVKFVVAADWNASAVKNSQTGEKYPAGTEWYLVKGGGVRTLLSTSAEENFDDPAVLTAAIKHAFTTYPAQRYGIVLWNHGGSWDGGYGGDTQNGTIADADTRGMTASEAADAISLGLSQAGISGTRALDFLAFDTCLMATAEVTELMRNLAQVYIANAELDFGSGWNYKDTFTSLAANTSMTASEFAVMEVAAWESLHKDASIFDSNIRSHVAIDTTKVDAFASAMQGLVTAIRSARTGGILTNAETLAHAAVFSLPGYGKTSSQKTDRPKYRDLGQFLVTAGADTTLGDIATKAVAAKQALDAMELGKSFGSLRTSQFAFHIAFPEVSSIADMLSNYRTRSAVWDAATGWGDFLSDLNASKSSTPPVFTHTLINGTNPDAANPPQVTIKVSTPAAAIGTMELVGTYSGKSVNYGTIATRAITTGTDTTMTWSGKSWIVGSKGQRSTTLPWLYTSDDLSSASGQASLIGAFGKVSMGDGSAEESAALLFKSDQSSASSIAYMFSNGLWEASSLSSFAAEHPNATFTPGLMNWENGTFIYDGMEAEAIPSSGLFSVQMSSLAANDYYLMTTSEDLWGNQTTEQDTVTVATPF